MKVLHITSELDGGGVDRILFDYFNQLKGLLQFDFVVTSSTKGILEDYLVDKGCNIFHIASYRESVRKHIKQLRTILEQGKYDIVHDHSGYKAAINLKIAKEKGIKIRVAHSHQANIKQPLIKRVERYVFTKLTIRYSTSLASCGKDAAIWMWGKKNFDLGNVFVIPNAIEVQKFFFSSDVRSIIRKELNIDNRIVIGTVARFSKQKNHTFLLEMFDYLHKKNNKYCLVLVGHGELFSYIQERAHQLGLDNDVIFLGVRNDVDKLLNAFDVFVLPSLFEGLPVSMVEVQMNGLPAVVSDNITNEIFVNDNVFSLSLDKGPKTWSEFIYNNKKICRIRVPIIANSNYNIENASRLLMSYYESNCKKVG